MAGPFKIESKPCTITAKGKAFVAATEAKPETIPDKTEISATVEQQLSKGRSWILISLIVVLAVAAGGLVIYRKKAAS